jgi:hypothetical protein
MASPQMNQDFPPLARSSRKQSDRQRAKTQQEQLTKLAELQQLQKEEKALATLCKGKDDEIERYKTEMRRLELLSKNCRMERETLNQGWSRCKAAISHLVAQIASLAPEPAAPAPKPAAPAPKPAAPAPKPAAQQKKHAATDGNSVPADWNNSIEGWDLMSKNCFYRRGSGAIVDGNKEVYECGKDLTVTQETVQRAVNECDLTALATAISPDAEWTPKAIMFYFKWLAQLLRDRECSFSKRAAKEYSAVPAGQECEGDVTMIILPYYLHLLLLRSGHCNGELVPQMRFKIVASANGPAYLITEVLPESFVSTAPAESATALAEPAAAPAPAPAAAPAPATPHPARKVRAPKFVAKPRTGNSFAALSAIVEDVPDAETAAPDSNPNASDAEDVSDAEAAAQDSEADDV